MVLKVNKKRVDIPSISELSTREFISIIFKNKIVDLKDYLAIFLSASVEDIMNAKIESVSIEAVHAALFDVDFEDEIRNPPVTFKYDDRYFLTRELELSTFGDNYMFQFFYDRYKNGKIEFAELALYALGCFLDEKRNTENIERIFAELSLKNWRKTLPCGFFLLKKFSRKKKIFKMRLILSMLELKVLRIMAFQMKKSRSTPLIWLFNRFRKY